MKCLLFYIFLSIFLLPSLLAQQSEEDYKQHTVKSGEDLITIARTYSINVGQLLKANPGTVHQGLSKGEVIYIPNKKVRKATEDERKIKGYRMKAGETLAGICQKYRMDLGQIRELNQFKSDYVREGQRILVITEVKHKDFFDVPDWMLRPAIDRPKMLLHFHKVKAGETLYSISKQYGISQKSIQEQNNLPDHNLNVGMTLRIRTPNPAVADSAGLAPEIIEELLPDPIPTVEREALLHESGIGVRIQQQRATSQKVALHRSAKVGSFIRVHNESNGTYCTVRVIGNFPNIEINRGVIIKISEEACRELGLVNNRFPIVISRPKEAQ